MAEHVLLDAAADLVDGGVVELVVNRGLVADERIQRGDLHVAPKRIASTLEPGRIRLPGAARHQIQQSRSGLSFAAAGEGDRERRNTLRRLRMSIVAAPDEVRDQVRNLTLMQLIRHLAAWRPDGSNLTDPVVAYRIALKSFGRRYFELTDEIVDLGDLVNPVVATLAPQLFERVGIGIEVVGQLLVTAGDNPSG